MNRPSKYHKSGTNGKERVWYWDSSHEDLEPTSTFTVNYKHFCSYCCKEAYSIQAGLREYGDYYKTTGYTCICESAEKEKELRKKLEKLEEEYKEKENLLKLSYSESLTHNKRKRLEIIHAAELKEMDRNEKNFVFRNLE